MSARLDAQKVDLTGTVESGQLRFNQAEIQRHSRTTTKAHEILQQLGRVVAQMDEAAGTFRLIVSTEPNGRIHNSTLTLELVGKTDSNTDPLMVDPYKLGISGRASRVLRSLQVRTIGDIAQLTETQLREPRESGDTTVMEVKELLKDFGLFLKVNVKA